MLMHTELIIQKDPIDAARLARPRTSSAGAVLTFLGVVRDSENDRPIRALEYEAFVPMAEHQFRLLFQKAEQRWPELESIRLVHRIGVVSAGEPSLWVEVASPHRSQAFEAAQWLIDEMKRVVPIWKKAVPVETSPESRA